MLTLSLPFQQYRLMQVLPGHALADPIEHIKQEVAAIEYGRNPRTSQHCPLNTRICMSQGSKPKKHLRLLQLNNTVQISQWNSRQQPKWHVLAAPVHSEVPKQGGRSLVAGKMPDAQRTSWRRV